MQLAAWIVALLASLGCSTIPTTQPLDGGSSVDQILDALDARGQGLTSLTADVRMTESDPDTGDEFARTGAVWLQTPPDGGARFRAMFDKKQSDNLIVEDRVEYLLDGQNLVDRTYRTRTQVTRQVLKPGEKINLLKLGEGPFPLPIGQDKAEVHKLFEVSRIPAREGDPPSSVHISLVPRPDSQFSRNFKSIDAWVDLADSMPKRIETVDPNGVTVRTTELSNVKLNQPLPPSDFALPPIDDQWTQLDEAYKR